MRKFMEGSTPAASTIFRTAKNGALHSSAPERRRAGMRKGSVLQMAGHLFLMFYTHIVENQRLTPKSKHQQNYHQHPTDDLNNLGTSDAD
jgi:hypothetical protein